MEINKNILEKEEIHGIWRIIPSISISEIISQSGYDFQILDCEHGGYDFRSLHADICACELNNSIPFVRVSGLNKVEVQRCLDLGAKGIVFPQINTFQDFKDASELLMYSPVGTRGFNPFVRSNKFGINENMLNAKPYCITIVESLKAVEEIERIVEIENIDMIYIGSYDLSAQLNCIGDMENDKLKKCIDYIIACCVSAGKKVSLMVHTKKEYEFYKNKGVAGFVHAVESFKIKTYFNDSLNSFKKAT
jgi:2-keto-3-deoxy-L-rhamnonate aldolase RhmA